MRSQLPILLCASILMTVALSLPAAPRIEVTVTADHPLTGHLILVLTRKDQPEPRFQVAEEYDSAQAFGVDVENLPPGKPIPISESTVGYPLERLTSVPAGDYIVQGVFNVYETFHLANGKSVELPPDRGEGQQWNSKPGNPYSKPQKIHFDPLSSAGALKITLDQVMPPVTPLSPETVEQSPEGKWLRFVNFRSPALSQFWGRDMFLGAWVLLPDGWSDHPNARFPLIVYQDHFHRDFAAGVEFHTTPRAGDGNKGKRDGIDYGYKFFQDWTSGRLPRVIIVYVQNANPYYDDSYVVNSANVGPYGDAVNGELLPEIEKRFRGIGQGWARATYGGSTGGWEALATQVFYPDSYNGAWSSCPDPIDFHAYQNTDLYNDKNAYFKTGAFGQIPIAEMREPDGTIVAEMEPANRREYVLGTHGRSAEQFDIWQAVFSPVGADGYPKAVYDKRSGVIDPEVVRYWHDHYDLTAIVQRDWAQLGPKLEGKLHLAAGDGDTWFLNNAVHLLQKTLEATRNPRSDATFDYGPRMPHCYTGDAALGMRVANGTLNQRVLPQMVEHMLATAPPGADIKSWRY